MDSSFFTTFQALIGAYLLYCGITGKGQAFKADTIREDQKPKFMKFMRRFCLVVGPVMLLSALFEYLAAQTPQFMIGVYITYGIFVVCLVYAIVVSSKMANRTPKKIKK